MARDGSLFLKDNSSFASAPLQFLPFRDMQKRSAIEGALVILRTLQISTPWPRLLLIDSCNAVFLRDIRVSLRHG
jgi:hypothetical protein